MAECPTVSRAYSRMFRVAIRQGASEAAAGWAGLLAAERARVYIAKQQARK